MLTHAIRTTSPTIPITINRGTPIWSRGARIHGPVEHSKWELSRNSFCHRSVFEGFELFSPQSIPQRRHCHFGLLMTIPGFNLAANVNQRDWWSSSAGTAAG